MLCETGRLRGFLKSDAWGEGFLRRPHEYEQCDSETLAFILQKLTLLRRLVYIHMYVILGQVNVLCMCVVDIVSIVVAIVLVFCCHFCRCLIFVAAYIDALVYVCYC